MPLSKTCVFALTLASPCFISSATVTACPPSAIQPSSTSPAISATPSHFVEPLPPGAKIISTRVLTPAEVAAREECPAVNAAVKPVPKTPKPELTAEVAPKATKKKKKATVETRDVVDLQTDEEIEVDVRFAEKAVGSAILISGDFETELEITDWKPNAICLRMPTLGILKPMNVRVALYRPDGYLIRQFDARLIRSQSIRRIERQRLVSTDATTTSFPADLP